MSKDAQDEVAAILPYGTPTMIVHHRQLPNQKAAFAMKLAEHLAIIACDNDGEDSAGRQKLRLLPPDEVAHRAVQIADSMWDQFATCGWIIDLPSWKDCMKMGREAEESEREARKK